MKKGHHLKETFDYIKALLDICENLFKATLKRVELTLKYIDEKDEDEKNDILILLKDKSMVINNLK